MRFSLKKQSPPPPPELLVGSDGMDGPYTDEESSYGPAPPPPPPMDSVPAEDIVAKKQKEYDDEELEEAEKMPVKCDPPPQDTTQDLTQNEDEIVVEGDDVERNKYEDDEAEYDDDDAESVEIPPTTVVQRMLAQESEAFGNKHNGKSSWFRMGSVMICCLLVVAIVLGVGFGTGAFTQDSTATGNGDRGGSKRSSNPDRANDIQLFLTSKSVVPENLKTTKTAEAKAMSWLIDSDPLELNTTSDADQFRLGQRYALLAFYYGSTGKWADEKGWLVLEDECQWFGVQCASKSLGGASVNAVTALALPSNNINSNIPADFVLLESMVTLDLSNNEMKQDLSSFGWKSLLSLLVLRLDSNSFSGDISMFTELPVTLQVLSIGNNAFSGTIPEGLSSFVELQELNFEANQLSGPISDVLSGLNVTILRIGENNYDAGDFPAFLYGMTQLHELSVGASNIISPLDDSVGSLTSLRVLYIYDNQLNGTFPSSLLNIATLEALDAHDCHFTGAFPDLGVWSNLTIFRVSDNEMTGFIPNTLDALPNLVSFRIDGNMITGSIPTTLTTLQRLELLNLSKNPMSGSLPSDLGALLSLRQMRINSMLHPDFPTAGIIGTIPTSIGSMSRLEVLELRGNFLDGLFPTALGGLNAIEIVDVQFNQLSGQIPASIGNWSDTITFIQFSNNLFSGTVPDTVCGGPVLETFVADCGLNCTCCTLCL
jgi:Leucine-rich repeat (LRR) protein